MNTPRFISLDQLPDWAQEMAKDIAPDNVTSLLNECSLMGKNLGVSIATEHKEPLPREFTEALKALGGADLSGVEVHSRIIEHVKKSCERALEQKRDAVSSCMNNFAFNTSPAMRTKSYEFARPEAPINLIYRIAGHPNLLATHYGHFYDAFDTSMEKHGLIEAYQATLDKEGWRQPGKTNTVIAPIFFELASQGWNLHFLVG